MTLLPILISTLVNTNMATESSYTYLDYSTKNISSNKLITLKLDQSDAAYKRGAYDFNEHKSNINKYQFVTLLKNKKLIDFIFHQQDESAPKLIVKNVDLNEFYPKKVSKIQCIDIIQSHFSEYNRKSKVFRPRAQLNELDLKDSVNNFYIRNYYKDLKSTPVVITNNCRSIGSFEYEWPGHFKGYFQIPPKLIKQFVEIPTNFTEVRFTKYYDDQINQNYSNSLKGKIVSLYSKFFEDIYRWYELSSFDHASSKCNIESFITEQNSNKVFKEVTFETKKGLIPYKEFSSETQLKSGYIPLYSPLSYIQSPCSKVESSSLPQGITSRKGHNLGIKKYWSGSPCEIIPHNFLTYEDITQYPVHLSNFEVDGVYTGKEYYEDARKLTPKEERLLSDEKSRPKFKYDFLSNFEKIFISKSNKLITIKLINSDHKNIIIGNIPEDYIYEEESRVDFTSAIRPWVEDEVRGFSSLFGISPLPLTSDYEDFKRAKKYNHYALFYNEKGEILDHHRRDIGVEYFYIRSKDNKLIIDLVSHERIMPLKRFIVNYSSKSF